MITGGIYIHVPFCVRKCKYCSFFSTKMTDENLEVYLKGIKNEISYYSNKDYKVKTIYFGGGTPSLLKGEYLEVILNSLNEAFDLTDLEELTLEANPESVNVEAVRAWKDLGFNRISLGIQTFDDNNLKLLGRAHNSEEARSALNILKKNFTNISADLICGLPNQSLSDWEKDLDNILEYDLNHISIYPLQIEPDTVLAKIIDNEYYNGIDDLMHDMMYLAKSKLELKGYNHYEIANYSKEGFESKHNLIYWTYKPYLGLGPSAASFYNGVRWQNTTNIDLWKTDLKKEIDNDSKKIEIQMAEFAFLALRLLDRGLNSDDFKRKFKISLESVHGETLDRLINYNWLTKEQNRYKLTTQAIFFANEVFAEFLPETN